MTIFIELPLILIYRTFKKKKTNEPHESYSKEDENNYEVELESNNLSTLCVNIQQIQDFWPNTGVDKILEAGQTKTVRLRTYEDEVVIQLSFDDFKKQLLEIDSKIDKDKTVNIIRFF